MDKPKRCNSRRFVGFILKRCMYTSGHKHLHYGSGGYFWSVITKEE